MFTERRLNEAYESAYRINIDDGDRIAIISDAHRGDSSFSDEFAQNQNILIHALNHYYRNGFTVIENGDGDELWEHPKFNYIYYAHQDVFDLIEKLYKDHRFYMVYGNHNIELRRKEKIKKVLWKAYDFNMDEYKDFLYGIEAYESIRLNYTPTGQQVYVVHGHQGDTFNDQLWFLAKFMMRFIWRYLHHIGFKNPSSPAKSHTKRHKLEKRYKKWIDQYKTIMVVGHTHRPKFSYPHEKQPYFNTGSCVRPRHIHAVEIVGGSISLVEWRISPNEDGVLEIIKKRLYGPSALSKYQF